MVVTVAHVNALNAAELHTWKLLEQYILGPVYFTTHKSNRGYSQPLDFARIEDPCLSTEIPRLVRAWLAAAGATLSPRWERTCLRAEMM